MTAIDSHKPNLSDGHWQTEFRAYIYWLHSKITAPLKRCVGCVNFFRLCRLFLWRIFGFDLGFGSVIVKANFGDLKIRR